jgi:hypothetical protein
MQVPLAVYVTVSIAGSALSFARNESDKWGVMDDFRTYFNFLHPRHPNHPIHHLPDLHWALHQQVPRHEHRPITRTGGPHTGGSGDTRVSVAH